MIKRTIDLKDLKKQELERVLWEVLEEGQSLKVRLTRQKAVVIEPARRLKPLPELDGSIPPGWKDAVYNGS
jgi:hypothetical protein